MYNCLSLIAYGCVYNFVDVSDCLRESATKMIQTDPKSDLAATKMSLVRLAALGI